MLPLFTVRLFLSFSVSMDGILLEGGTLKLELTNLFRTVQSGQGVK
jgi:hypothetical protein